MRDQINDKIKIKSDQLTKDNRDAIITQLIPLIERITARFRFKYPEKDQDILTVAKITMIQCVDKIINNPSNPNREYLEAYIHKSVKFEVQRFIYTDHAIRPPKESKWLTDAIKEGGETAELAFESFRLQYSFDYLHVDLRSWSASMDPLHIDSPEDTLNQQTQPSDFYYFDIMTSPNFTKTEKEIIHYRLEGWSDREIAEKMSKSTPWVFNMRKMMESRIRRIIFG